MNLAMLALHSSPVGSLGARDAGGMSVVLLNLVAALARRSHRVDLFTCRGDAVPGRPVDLAPGVRLFRLDAGGAASVPKDRLHTHLPAACEELGRLAAERGSVYDLVYSHYWVSGLLGRELSRAWDVPHLVTFHTLGAAKSRLVCGEDASPRRLQAERELAGCADRVIAPSQRERGLTGECCGVPPDRVAVVPWGVDLVLFSPGDQGAARAALEIQADRELLLFVGRFAPVKGLDLLLRALPGVLRERPQAHLLVAGGDGPEGPDTRAGFALAEELEVQGRVTWLGPIPRREMPALYRAADLLVVPSRYESFGLVALEALACGTPVVGPRVGVLDEVVVPGCNGCIATDAAPEPLAEAIVCQLEDPRPVPAAVRATVEAWTWDRSAGMIEAMMRECATSAL